MKKLLLIATLMLALVFTVVACNNDPVTEETTLGDTTVETPTEAPTAEPEDPTEPEETTEAPEETTEAPEETTEAPEETTEAPEETTEEVTTEEVTEPDPSEPVLMLDPDTLNTLAGATDHNANQIGSSEVITEGKRTFVRWTAAGGDPYVAIIPLGDLRVLPQYMAISYRTNSAVEGQFFTASFGGWTGNGDSFSVTWTEGDWSFMVIDMTKTGVSSLNGTEYNFVRMDFFAGNSAEGDYFDVEYVGFFNTAEYAAAYDFEMHKAPMWDADKAVISHQSFDELDKYAADTKIEGVFTPGQSGGWDKVLTLNDFSVEALRYWGWIAGVTEQGVFGYQINGGAAIYDEAWTHPEDLMAHAPAGSTYTTRMKIMISLEGLVGENTIRALYKDAAGTEVCLNEFTVVLPARAPFEVPEHMDETINLATGHGDPYGAEKKFGQRYNIGENFLKQITVTNMASYADGNTNKWSVKIWAWNTDYATTTAAEPLFVLNGENHQDCSSFVVDVPAELGIMGDFYYEVEYLEGSAQFTGWTADNVAEGVETYANGNLKAGSYASSIVVGVAIPEGATITVIDLSAVTSTGNYPTVDNPIPGSLFGAAHCYALHYGSINLGEMDLSKYSKVTITYSTPDDATVPTASAEYNMTGKRVLLLNAPSAAEDTFEYLPEESAIITSTQYELSPASLIPTTVEIDLSEITYNGDVYLTFDFRDPNNGVAVNAYVVWVIGITFS